LSLGNLKNSLATKSLNWPTLGMITDTTQSTGIALKHRNSNPSEITANIVNSC